MNNTPPKLDKRNAGGLWIVFLGPDGVGKSTVMERLPEHLGAAFTGCRRFHFRTRFSRREMAGAPVIDPHGQRPRGLLVSVGKLMFWLLDGWFGYLLVVCPGRRRSRLVMFDRYYPDVLVDPVRYRLPHGALKFATVFAALAPQPDLYVLLDAPAETAQQRKQEITRAESQRQRAAYLKMFEALPATLVVDADGPVEEVTQQLARGLFSFLEGGSHQATFSARFPVT